MPSIISLILLRIREEIQETSLHCPHRKVYSSAFTFCWKVRVRVKESVWRNWVHFNKWPLTFTNWFYLGINFSESTHASLLFLPWRLLYWDLYFNIHLSSDCGDTQREEGAHCQDHLLSRKPEDALGFYPVEILMHHGLYFCLKRKYSIVL